MLALTCQYQYIESGQTTTYTAPCSKSFIDTFSVSTPDDEIKAIPLGNDTTYTSVLVRNMLGGPTDYKKVLGTMVLKDNTVVRCSANVNTISVLKGCTLTPGSSTLDLNINKAESLVLTCNYQIPGQATVYTGPCYKNMINSLSTSQSPDPVNLGLSVITNGTKYDSVDVFAKSVSLNNKVTMNIQTLDGDSISCDSFVNVTNIPRPKLESCILLPKNVTMYVGNTIALNLACVYKSSQTNALYTGACLKKYVMSGSVGVYPDDVRTVNATLVSNETNYFGVRAEAVNPSYNQVVVDFYTPYGNLVSCHSNVTVNFANNNTNTTNKTSGGNGGDGVVQKTTSGYWCSVDGPTKVYTDSKDTYSVVCHRGTDVVDCSATGSKTYAPKVTWIMPNNQQYKGESQSVKFGYNPGTVKISASWNAPGGYDLSCGEIEITSEVPTCFKFL